MTDETLSRAHAAWMLALGKMPDDVTVVMTTEQARTALKAAIDVALAAQPSAGAQGEAKNIWPNGVERRAPEAFRYLATNDRPSGGEQFPNAACLYQMADEIEEAHRRSIATPAQPDTHCKTCGGKGYTTQEGGDSTQSIVEYEACPICTAQPDTGDVAALRERIARIVDPKGWEFYDRHKANPVMGAEIALETRASLVRADRILAAVSKPNVPRGVGND